MNRPDLYARVTQQIVEQLEQGVRPWVQPWNNGAVALPRRVTGEFYRGVNVLILWSAAQKRQFTHPTWMTYRQAMSLGGQVRKGETATKIYFAAQIEKGDEDDIRTIHFLKEYSVFNGDQIDRLPDHFRPAPPQPLTAQRPACIDEILNHCGVRITYGGGQAFYAPGPDMIQLPPYESFHSPEQFAATALHELAHATGHASRLDRKFGERFTTEARAMEELVAECSASFSCAALGIEPSVREDHIAYLQSWLSILKSDSRAIFIACSAAQKATDYILDRCRPAEAA